MIFVFVAAMTIVIFPYFGSEKSTTDKKESAETVQTRENEKVKQTIAEPVAEPDTPPGEDSVENDQEEYKDSEKTVEPFEKEHEDENRGPLDASPDEQVLEPVTTEKEHKLPDELSQILGKSSTSIDEVNNLGCSQLIVVDYDKTGVTLMFFSYDGVEWVKDDNLTCKGFVGRNGISAEKREGDGNTPIGIFPIGDAFFIYAEPETGLNTFKITEDTYWVDDPDSVYYNCRVEGTADKDWKSAEHMIAYSDAYEYGFVIGYNVEANYGMGSAIFFHVSSRPTAGCVGTSKEYVLRYLDRLSSDKNPYIIIA